ncbi:MAG: hypothetical protein COU29_03195 [Candidatus Magasanikbacteria bacterium CG10_big_fil_rev_8_21_14_0_10_36_32]|uniref:Heat-inducible transcription repressor HrcA C-terminal domain-containing protein n=1 Tax=Candidatus Magasanikbacteria bacterium CG10_big_fil_rev_8_21_14_0_10_36_32 TaxID=1974646 RepID=A0A2M6W641_9BACT|nr:MAG: hypothetical protein COU29_03195 [Candidatus Magasanikbacteria bacterium CG10_big_fil_rev_8_21_14_0_10_36_32]
MNKRQEQLLALVIEKYVETAEPIGSKFLVDEGDLEWGEATVRNELRALEKAGYLTHPHTSAGRIPTEKGYRYYIAHLALDKAKLKNSNRTSLERAFNEVKDYEMACKNVAKLAAELSGESIIFSFGINKVYHTGLSNLIGKPEFGGEEAINILKMFDQCEEYLNEFVDEISDVPRFFIGSEQPFGESVSLTASLAGRDNDAMFIVLSPNRTDYRRNFALLKTIREILS